MPQADRLALIAQFDIASRGQSLTDMMAACAVLLVGVMDAARAAHPRLSEPETFADLREVLAVLLADLDASDIHIVPFVGTKQ